MGGAQMLGAAGNRLDVGARNEAATRSALTRAGVRIVAAATGGTAGRTVRVHVGPGEVSVKEAGGAVDRAVAGRPARRWGAAA